MPSYEFQCKKCNLRVELFRTTMDSTAPKKCTICSGSEFNRIFSTAAAHFIGDGFYAPVKDK